MFGVEIPNQDHPGFCYVLVVICPIVQTPHVLGWNPPLAGGLEHEFYFSRNSWECHHPN